MLRILAAASVAVLAACGSPAAMDHIHAVTITEDGVFVGTHNGLWQVSEDAPPTQVSAQEWDIMGVWRTTVRISSPLGILGRA